MPTYQYACTACDERLEAVQSFTDAPLTECPACAGTLRKVFSAVGVVFKGSGFYKTDSRRPAGAANGSASEGTSQSTSEGKSEGKSDATRAESKAGSGDKAASSSSGGDSSSSTSSSKPAAVPASKSA